MTQDEMLTLFKRFNALTNSNEQIIGYWGYEKDIIKYGISKKELVELSINNKIEKRVKRQDDKFQSIYIFYIKKVST